jgi:hypothetical protein
MQGGRVPAAGAALLGLLLLTADVRADAERGRVSVRLPLEILLTVAPDLRESTKQTLIREAARIWGGEHVDLRWPVVGETPEPPEAPLRVLVMTRPDSAAEGHDRWPVAEILSHQQQRAIAIASIASARRVVDEAARAQLFEHPANLEYRLGLVLGRAVAHEIGHFLLSTSSHAERGLMRAHVAAGEFAALGRDQFRLDDEARRWIRERLVEEPPTVAALRSGRFSYARQ